MSLGHWQKKLCCLMQLNSMDLETGKAGLEISNYPLAPHRLIFWGQADLLGRLPPGQSEILQQDFGHLFL